MTREERAIKNLKQMCSDGRYLGSGSFAPLEVLEDFSLAIKALEQEFNPIAIVKIKYDEDKLKELVDKAVFTTAMPQESKWIPVTERLPNKDGEYLLFGKINEDEENYIFVGEYDSCGEQFGIWQEQFDRATLGCLGSEFFEYSSVLAWQPLPKPYEESEGV